MIYIAVDRLFQHYQVFFLVHFGHLVQGYYILGHGFNIGLLYHFRARRRL